MILGPLFKPGGKVDYVSQGKWRTGTVIKLVNGFLTIRTDKNGTIIRHVRNVRGYWPGPTVEKAKAAAA
jgi:hypothetical protein